MQAATRLAPRTLAGVLAILLVSACAPLNHAAPESHAPLVSVADRDLPQPLMFIAYGDMRFTTPTETRASSPTVRQALVTRIATEKPAALLLSGDLPYHGGQAADYAVYSRETHAWAEQGLRVYPALGNHEFAQCAEEQCLENWWSAFPALRGHRWYSAALGSQVLAIALDSDTSLQPGSPQRLWLEREISLLPQSVRFVMISLHHPPVADLATGSLASHNPRPNEIALADYLGSAAGKSHARFIVVAGHTHNYERFEKKAVVYLVSGGGGAAPYVVERGPEDLYRGRDEINYHYLRFTLTGNRLKGEMVRVEDPESPTPHQFAVRDTFEVLAR